jgi:hypothetical protein
LPFEGLRQKPAATATSPSQQPPLMRFAAFQSVVYNRVSGRLGYPTPPRRFSFPSRPRGFPPAAVPQSFRSGFILSYASVPSRVSRATTRPTCADHLPWALVPLRGTSLRSPRTRASQARFVPSSAFLTPSTASSSAHLAGLFHPAATSRVHSSGVSPREKPYGLVTRRCPHVVCVAPLPPVLPNGSRKRRPPSGPYSTRESVANNGGLDHRPLDPLLSFSLPRVFLRAP